QRTHVFDGDDHFDLERLAHTGIDDVHGAGAPGAVGVDPAAPEETGDLVERALRGGQADALERRPRLGTGGQVGRGGRVVATIGGWSGSSRRSAARAMPMSGARRFFSTSTARARKGEM